MAYRETAATRRRADERRAGFVRAARDLVAAHGFASAKVRAVAMACGTSTGALYSYFNNRDELMAEVFRDAAGHELAVVRDAMAQARGRPASTAVDRLDVMIETFTGRALRGRQLAWSLLFEPTSPIIEAERRTYRHAYVELGESVIRDGIAHGLFTAQDPTLAAAAQMGAIAEALVGRLSPVGADALVQMSDELVITEIRAYCFRALGCATTTAPHLSTGQP